MNLLASFEKYKSFFTVKVRFFLINLLILTSLSFVILKNINEIRYKTLSTEKGETLILDRFKSKIRVEE